MRTRAAVAVWTVALLIAAGALALAARSDHENALIASGAFATAVGLAFVGAGLIAWTRRPDNRTGALMTAVGFSWFIGALAEAESSVPFTVGFAFGSVTFAFFGWLVLAFPSGRLETRLNRGLVAAAFVLVTVSIPVWTLFDDLRDDAPSGSPENAFLVDRNETVALALDTANQIVALLLIAATVGVLVVRWRHATTPLRRALAPVFVAGGATLLVLAGTVFSGAIDADSAEVAFEWLTRVALFCVPAAFLLGLLQTRLARSSVGRLVVELGGSPAPGELRDALARTLNDPSLTVAYRVGDETYVDVEGQHIELPEKSSGRVTYVEREGRCVAALVHDPSVGEDPELVDAACAAAALALENERRLAALAESEARNRALLDALPDLVFRIAPDGTFLDFKGDEGDLAAPRGEVIGKNIFDVLPADVAERIMRCARKAQERDSVQTVEYELTVDGVTRHFEARVVPSGEEEVLLVVRDFSERKRAEAELERLHAELRTRLDELRRERDFIRDVVQASASIFCLVTPSGEVVRFNRRLEEMSGYVDDDAARGRPFWDVFVTPEEADDVRTVLAETAAGRRSGERENRWLTRDGEERVVAWSATQLRGADGEPRILISGLDVTARKRQEEELRRLYGELEERLQELQASRARIVEAGAVERRRLERNLHDGAQQRLVSISLILRLVESKLRSDPESAEKLLANGRDELARALEELRELARGIHPAVLTDRGLGPALEALVARMPLPVTVVGAPEHRLPEPVEAAAYYVVSEALANVAKYADASTATIRIARADGSALVEVADDGVGGADPARGSGLLGLADRVAALDGRLDVESPAGGGTTVRAHIPCA